MVVSGNDRLTFLRRKDLHVGHFVIDTGVLIQLIAAFFLMSKQHFAFFVCCYCFLFSHHLRIFVDYAQMKLRTAPNVGQVFGLCLNPSALVWL